ncbi:hypothetical protein [Klebsiella quasipneumoniae]|nr:hypothetical protein [Klebsiella quasipneumoniae]HCA6534601.1 hypothetical protein [Klebsiella quasipneumoniae]
MASHFIGGGREKGAGIIYIKETLNSQSCFSYAAEGAAFSAISQAVIL